MVVRRCRAGPVEFNGFLRYQNWKTRQQICPDPERWRCVCLSCSFGPGTLEVRLFVLFVFDLSGFLWGICQKSRKCHKFPSFSDFPKTRLPIFQKRHSRFPLFANAKNTEMKTKSSQPPADCGPGFPFQEPTTGLFQRRANIDRKSIKNGTCIRMEGGRGRGGAIQWTALIQFALLYRTVLCCTTLHYTMSQTKY